MSRTPKEENASPDSERRRVFEAWDERLLIRIISRYVLWKMRKELGPIVPEDKPGLLRDSILANTILHPSRDDAALVRRSTVAGRMVGYDFRRPEEFGRSIQEEGRNVRQGALAAMILRQIEKNPPEKLTPTSLPNVCNLAHFLTLERMGVQAGIDLGLLTETTYADAYRQADQYDRWEEPLAKAGVLADTIYQVTPKGNGLVMLIRDAGDNEQRRNQSPAFDGAWRSGLELA